MLIYKPKKDFTESVSWSVVDKVYEVDNMLPSMWFTFVESVSVPIFIDPVDDRFIYVHVDQYVIRYWRHRFLERFEPDVDANRYLFKISGEIEDF